MNIFLLIAIIVLCVAVFGKWLLIALVFPFQVLYGSYKRHRSPFRKILAAPYALWERLFRNGWQRYMLYQVAFIPSLHFRRFIYKALGCRMGKRVVFHFGTEIREITRLSIGDGSIIGDRAILDARRGLVIGSNVNLSSDVSIYTIQHDHRAPDFSCKPEGGQIVIGDRAWIGSNATLLPGVTVGEGAVCCAGCVVTKDVEPYTVVAGIPARKVNDRPRDLTYQFNGRANRLY